MSDFILIPIIEFSAKNYTFVILENFHDKHFFWSRVRTTTWPRKNEFARSKKSLDI